MEGGGKADGGDGFGAGVLQQRKKQKQRQQRGEGSDSDDDAAADGGEGAAEGGDGGATAERVQALLDGYFGRDDQLSADDRFLKRYILNKVTSCCGWGEGGWGCFGCTPVAAGFTCNAG